MSILISIGNSSTAYVDTTPDECPFCHTKIVTDNIYAKVINNKLHAFLACPSTKCNETFIAYYQINYSLYEYKGIKSLSNLKVRNFNDTIKNISNSFVEIYNQAFSAEQQGLSEICGVGYRKSLEFLIKDYLIFKCNDPEKHATIREKFLGVCIKEFVDDSRIKKVAQKATWLGNDETHYERRWEGKDVSDLKILIDLTVYWIEAEVLTERYESDMRNE